MAAIFTAFTYKDTPGSPNYIKTMVGCTNTHWPSTPLTESGTDDPQWQVVDGNSHQQYAQLAYIGEDGEVYRAEIHAEYCVVKSLAQLWFKNYRPDGGTNDDSNDIVILCGDGQLRRLIMARWIPNNTPPVFTFQVVADPYLKDDSRC